MRLADLVCNPGSGRLSLTKLAATTGHALAAAGFVLWNVVMARQGLLPDGLVGLWAIYLGVCGLHHAVDKSVAAWRERGRP